MITNLAELHDEIHESFDAIVVIQIGSARDEIGDGNVLSKSSIHESLTRGEFTENVNLNLYHIMGVCQRTEQKLSRKNELTLSPNSFWTFFLIRRNIKGFRII